MFTSQQFIKMSSVDAKTLLSLYLTLIDTKEIVNIAYANLNKLYEDGPNVEGEVNIAKNALAIAVTAFEEARNAYESSMTTR